MKVHTGEQFKYWYGGGFSNQPIDIEERFAKAMKRQRQDADDTECSVKAYDLPVDYKTFPPLPAHFGRIQNCF